MIRKAKEEDISAIAQLYNDAIDYEDTHEKHTSWQKGIYPTKDTATAGFKNGSLYVFEDNGRILAAVILDTRQPPEYRNIDWGVSAKHGEALVVHTLCVHPECGGLGIGSAILDFAKQVAKQMGCLAIRLNTTSKNTLATHFYKKNGFVIAAKRKILLNGQIACGEHSFMEYKIK